MNDKLQSVLAGIAEKMGTSAERLWPLLVQREVASAWINLGGVAVMLLVYLLLIRKWRSSRDSDLRDNGLFFLIVAGVVVFCITMGIGSEAIITILSPEASTLAHLLNGGK